MNGGLIAATAFAAAAVEAVEALTIVLAAGAARSWRSSLAGAGWALAALAAIVLAFGPVLVAYVPFSILEAAVGTFLLLFGLAWLRKAILRYSGRKALHDEAAIFARTVTGLRGATKVAGRDRLAFATAFNAVLLEGLEVIAIVVSVGASSAAALRWASAGALLAVLVVAAAGAVLRAPIARVPENALKFGVGIMLTSFGTFWSGEGLGVVWWRGDLSLPLIMAAYLAVSGLTIAAARRRGSTVRRVA